MATKKQLELIKNNKTQAMANLTNKARDLRDSGLSDDAIKKQLKSRIGGEAIRAIGGRKETGFTTTPASDTTVDTASPTTQTNTTTPTQASTNQVTPTQENIVEPTQEQTTLRDRVAQQVATGNKTREQELAEQQTASGRGELVKQGEAFRQEASNVVTDIENISKGLESEGGAITTIAASRIREARSAPLRETLTSLVKGQELTQASIKDIDSSITGILEARELDRQDANKRIAGDIESSNLSDDQKDELLSKLQVQTSQSKQRDELEAFQQKEVFKSQIEQAEKASISSTGLGLEQNIILGKVLNNYGAKEDSVIGNSISQMLKEGRSEQEINRILDLSTDEEGNFVNDTQFSRRKELRKEFEASEGVKGFRKSSIEFSGLIDNLKEASGPGDIAVLFQFMKTLDPTSVVRESEFDAIAKAMGFADRVDLDNNISKIKEGTILGDLTSNQREKIRQTAENLFNTKRQNYTALAFRSVENAVRDGVDPKSVVLDYREVPGLADVINGPINIDEQRQVDNLFGGTESVSGKQYNLDAFGSSGFNTGDKTSSTNGVASFIKSKEGFRQNAYLDSAGVPTIGYGATKIDGKPVQIGDTISKERAEQVFNDDLSRHSNFKNLVEVDLSPRQQTALASFEFNLGPNIWKTTGKDILDAINRGDLDTATNIMLAHNKARNKKTGKLEVIKGLTSRRKEEADLLKMIS